MIVSVGTRAGGVDFALRNRDIAVRMFPAYLREPSCKYVTIAPEDFEDLDPCSIASLLQVM